MKIKIFIAVKKKNPKQNKTQQHKDCEMNIITPMNCVNQISGVKEDHTGHNSMVKLQDKYREMFE